MSQFILRIYFHQINKYKFRSAIPIYPSKLKYKNNIIYYSETGLKFT